MHFLDSFRERCNNFCINIPEGFRECFDFTGKRTWEKNYLNPSNLGSSFFVLSTQCFESNSKQVFSAMMMMMMRKTECTALLLRIDTRFLLGDIFKIHSKGATPIVNFSDLISNFLFKIWVTRYLIYT